MERFFIKKSITAVLAQELLNKAYKKAIELGCQVSISIVDDCGMTKAFLRMDQASLLSVDIAFKKAYTSIANGRGFSSQEMFEYSQKNPAAIAATPTIPNITTLSGGYSIKMDNAIIGAIGVSGGSTEQDMIIAKYAIENLN
jgi:uncharacterized protein GlcG (DUF336 family)